jgi:N-acetylglucosaminyldiphosphoundecaprenol N-acetyl-beta-D-mannosaminyltransferase
MEGGQSVMNNKCEGRHSLAVIGSKISVTDYTDLSAWILEQASNAGTFAVDFANAYVITLRRHNRHFSGLYEAIDVTVPDGMPLLWIMNLKGANLNDRVYGPIFTRKFLSLCPPGKTHYLLGGSEECGLRFRERMLSLNPSLEFVGGYHGVCSAEGVLANDHEVLTEIRAKRPDFIWVGLGTPKQYGWIARAKTQIDHGIILAVGFAFDVNAGMKTDAPQWMQKMGLTWLHRMISEPRRLAGRYLKYNFLFILYLVIGLFRRAEKDTLLGCGHQIRRL